jgi:hypothetical protein
MDSYTQSFIKVYVHIDAGQRVWCKNEQLEVTIIGGEKKVVLPIGKLTYTFDDLKRAGARCDVVTLKSLAQQGAEGRWKEEIQQRRETGLPSNVYIANARSIQYAIDKGKTPPSMTYVGRKRDQITETYDTVDEVVDAMANGLWRTEFSRGGKAKRKSRR